jgi:hypothetical protein
VLFRTKTATVAQIVWPAVCVRVACVIISVTRMFPLIGAADRRRSLYHVGGKQRHMDAPPFAKEISARVHYKGQSALSSLSAAMLAQPQKAKNCYDDYNCAYDPNDPVH